MRKSGVKIENSWVEHDKVTERNTCFQSKYSSVLTREKGKIGIICPSAAHRTNISIRFQGLLQKQRELETNLMPLAANQEENFSSSF